jgi:hypothetical protein
MSALKYIIDEVPGLYQLIALQPLRKTENVDFDTFPENLLPKIDAIDRVIHQKSAISPGPIEGVERPWYMHPYQADNLLVLQGTRFVEVYSVNHGKLEEFEVQPNKVMKNGKLLHDGAAILVWPCSVFHRIKSGKEGSVSVNLATHYDRFDIKTNFNIYDLDQETGKYKVIREGHKDQFCI